MLAPEDMARLKVRLESVEQLAAGVRPRGRAGVAGSLLEAATPNG
jgi:hypothetical protein